ncbi:hypothetical protein TREMEDRAFT_60487 [Tremella mesenterica DSM 1558]|uniref:uncharacterized protein n=1 Tax=Tremella mesenterica (strain ATCC 24925 / CBS 8224 / DSM 1558 / NBRC 9311 / NRRL Y-6157 / RJB 2259-6 / UBC 559-6) TaxID=578456 RepID=UPI0003F49C53|nr:uncharacterized protein TREMEDRAFT_60487 [Tremella mesenterica DSM 1558]EIW71564.1 hypothetical protein TREMEDRAFT_60487 [Tremella mesenterica DSM 1558]
MQMTPEDDIVDLEAQARNRVINEEYKVWKKNTPFLYDTVITHALTWPSLTCQWLPDMETPKDADYTIHRIILGTHTSGQTPNHLMIAEVLLPKVSVEKTREEVADMYDEERQELGSHTKSPVRVRVKQTIHHDGEVNKARYMPQNPDLIATKTPKGEVYIFDRTKHESKAPVGGECKPDIRLKGMSKEGFGLSWSPMAEGHILSSGEDGFVAHWDIQAYDKKDPSLQPLRKYTGHSSNVSAVDWHPFNGNLFGSVGDDCHFMLWDTRSEITSKPSQKVEAHAEDVNCLAFAPSSEHLVLTGSNDKTIALWDLRKLGQKLHSFEAHKGAVTEVVWSPHSAIHFASASADRRVHIWNMDAIGEEQTPDDAEDGPPELLFVHGGHTSKPGDISWSSSARWHIATTTEDNILQIWEPSRHIRTPADGVIDAMELE